MCVVVSVLCELILKELWVYFFFVFEFYRLLDKFFNNWFLIKLVKIFGVLIFFEFCLGCKIVGFLCDFMRKVYVKLLFFECICIVMFGLCDYIGVVKLCVEKLRENMDFGDLNLKYLGLKVFVVLMDFYLWVLVESKEVIIKCLNDGDISI